MRSSLNLLSEGRQSGSETALTIPNLSESSNFQTISSPTFKCEKIIPSTFDIIFSFGYLIALVPIFALIGISLQS